MSGGGTGGAGSQADVQQAGAPPIRAGREGAAGDASAPVRLRPADPADAAALAAVSRATSTPSWSTAMFAAELQREDRRYVVAVLDRDAGGADDGAAHAGTAAGGEVAAAGDGSVGGATDGAAGGGATDGAVVGYGSLALLAGDGHVLGLGVTPQRQGSGIGRQLLLALLAAAGDAAMAGVTLEVRPSNDVARHLYRSCGFEEAGRRPRYYPDGEDALLLWWHHPTVTATDRERA